MSRIDRPALVRLALVVIVLLALSGSGRTLYRAIDAYRASRTPSATERLTADRMSRSEARYQALRLALPDTGVVGYVSDELEDGSFTSMAALQDFFLTQYSLAPVIVQPGARHALVVGNFSDSPRTLPGQLTLLWDFGDGVLLFQAAKR